MSESKESMIIGAGEAKLWFVGDLFLNKQDPAPLLEEWRNVVRDKKDGVVILGNVASDQKAFWFNQLKELPGKKILFCGDQETNRIKWYYKFGFSGVVPFNEVRLLECVYGKILVSHLPAFESVAGASKYVGLSRKFSRLFDLNSCVLNIHGHTGGQGNESHRTFDVSYSPAPGQKLLSADQIIEHKFRQKS